MALDYEAYKDRPNVSFVGICSTPGADMRSMKNEQVKLKIDQMPFPKMLDASGATLASYGLSPKVPYQLVVLDSESKIAFNTQAGGAAGPYRIDMTFLDITKPEQFFGRES